MIAWRPAGPGVGPTLVVLRISSPFASKAWSVVIGPTELDVTRPVARSRTMPSSEICVRLPAAS